MSGPLWRHPQSTNNCVHHSRSSWGTGLRPRDARSAVRRRTKKSDNRLESEHASSLSRFYASTHTPLVGVWGPKSAPHSIRTESDYGRARDGSQGTFSNTVLTQSHEAAKVTRRVCPQITQIELSWNLRPSAKSSDLPYGWRARESPA